MRLERIEHRLDALDLAERRITLPGGAVIEADGLLLATGGEPRRLEVEGADLEGVMTLRTWADADRLAELAGDGGVARRVVVIGASFIAMEAAASLGQRGIGKVVVVAPEEVPFEASLGKRLGTLLRGIHESHGVDFRLGRSVKSFTGDDRVRGVTLDDGTELDADLVLMGVGVRPATDFIRGIELEPDGSVLVDELLRVRDGVYAAGDIATFPDWRTGEPTRIEHWRSAQQQGAIAGRNLDDVTHDGMPVAVWGGSSRRRCLRLEYRDRRPQPRRRGAAVPLGALLLDHAVRGRSRLRRARPGLGR